MKGNEDARGCKEGGREAEPNGGARSGAWVQERGLELSARRDAWVEEGAWRTEGGMGAMSCTCVKLEVRWRGKGLLG